MLILNGVETKLEVSMENEIKSVSDIISEISKKDKKRQVFILTNLINQLKSTRIEANSNYEDCRLSYTRRTDNYIGNFKLMLFKKDGELWIVLLVICVILLKINLILN